MVIRVKEGKQIWAILFMLGIVVMICGTIGVLIVNGRFDYYNLVIILILVFGLSEQLEKKK